LKFIFDNTPSESFNSICALLEKSAPTDKSIIDVKNCDAVFNSLWVDLLKQMNDCGIKKVAPEINSIVYSQQLEDGWKIFCNNEPITQLDDYGGIVVSVEKNGVEIDGTLIRKPSVLISLSNSDSIKGDFDKTCDETYTQNLTCTDGLLEDCKMSKSDRERNSIYEVACTVADLAEEDKIFIENNHNVFMMFSRHPKLELFFAGILRRIDSKYKTFISCILSSYAYASSEGDISDTNASSKYAFDLQSSEIYEMYCKSKFECIVNFAKNKSNNVKRNTGNSAAFWVSADYYANIKSKYPPDFFLETCHESHDKNRSSFVLITNVGLCIWDGVKIIEKKSDKIYRSAQNFNLIFPAEVSCWKTITTADITNLDNDDFSSTDAEDDCNAILFLEELLKFIDESIAHKNEYSEILVQLKQMVKYVIDSYYLIRHLSCDWSTSEKSRWLTEKGAPILSLLNMNDDSYRRFVELLDDYCNSNAMKDKISTESNISEIHDLKSYIFSHILKCGINKIDVEIGIKITTQHLQNGWKVSNTESKIASCDDDELTVYGVIQNGVEIDGRLFQPPEVNVKTCAD